MLNTVTVCKITIFHGGLIFTIFILQIVCKFMPTTVVKFTYVSDPTSSHLFKQPLSSDMASQCVLYKRLQLLRAKRLQVQSMDCVFKIAYICPQNLYPKRFCCMMCVRLSKYNYRIMKLFYFQFNYSTELHTSLA